MKHLLAFYLLFIALSGFGQTQRPRVAGITIGVLPAGKNNAITDVEGVRVGHVTRIDGSDIRTGVTAVIPHSDNVFKHKVPAAIYIGNGFGKLAGYSQVEELGLIETPIILTNTLSVAEASNALITYTLEQPANKDVRSVNPVVGETNDGYLNDIRGRHITEQDVLKAIETASAGIIPEGNIGAGTGTVCFGFKGGIGTASRKLPESLGGYTVGVLVQTNFGGVLVINGAPVGVELSKYAFKNMIESVDGSCMIVVATDAPITSRNLKRLAKRTLLGMGKTGGIASNGSGDYVIAFSTHESLRESYQSESNMTGDRELRNDQMSPLFMAAIEATEEAIINSLFAAETMRGFQGRVIEELPVQKVLDILKKYNRIND
ncbi:MAG: P1 family peptidase [Bacteroidetes bacterium]|nr:P1 family peptidase [Bacteroidota bacterium]